jgi:antitoxin YefM
MTPIRILVILLTMSTTLSLAQAKSHLSEQVGRVTGQHERVTVTVHGRPSADLLAVDDLDA